MTHSLKGRESRGAFLAGALLITACVLARDHPPEAPPPTPLKLLTPSVAELSNGLRVVVVERRALPILTLRLLVQAGAESDPPDLPGTAQLTAQVLSQGTSRRSALEISEAVDSMGAQLSTGAGWDQSYAEITALSHQSDQAFELLAEVSRNPAFPPEEVERKQQQTISALQLLRDDPAYMADTVFHVLVFQGTPYGHPLDGTVETVRKLSSRELEQFHRKYYQPGNCILAVVGDTNPDEAIALAKKFFANWKGAGVPKTAHVSTPVGAIRKRLVVVDKPDAVQTEIRAGFRVTQRDSDEYYALTVANQVLGGPAVNRLYRELRSRQGLAYGASSDIEFQQSAGSWMAKTSTRTSETVRSLRGVIDEIERLRKNHVSTQELGLAKNYLVGHMALEFETSDDVAAQTLELMEHRLPLSYWNDFPQKVYAIEAGDVSDVANKYLAEDRQTVVLVGNTGRFSKELQKLGPFETLSLQDLDLASPRLGRPDR